MAGPCLQENTPHVVTDNMFCRNLTPKLSVQNCPLLQIYYIFSLPMTSDYFDKITDEQTPMRFEIPMPVGIRMRPTLFSNMALCKSAYTLPSHLYLWAG